MKIEWTRIKSDINGNPRYVCHFLNMLTPMERSVYEPGESYRKAVKRANRLGGRKYHTKAYGGGIVFTEYSLQDLEKHIERELYGVL